MFRRHLCLILSATALVMFVVIVYQAHMLGMGDSVHGRYVFHAFPTVLSHSFHDLPWNYTAYEGLARSLTMALRSGPLNDLSLETVATLKHFNHELWFFPFDDKGYTDLAWLGFTLFGLHVSSVLHAYCFLFGITLLCFLLAFHRDPPALIAVNLLLAGIFVSLYAFPLVRELREITNPRAIGLLSVLSMAHLLIVCLRQKPIGFGGTLLVLLQSALIVFVFFCRSSEALQILLVLGFAAFVGAVSLYKRRSLVAPATVLVSLFLCFLGLQIYQRVYFHSAYFQTHGQYRLVWHNAGIGFALNPVLAKGYGLSISDGAMFRIVKDRARKSGEYDRIFTDEPRLLSNPIKDFVAYEQHAREIVIEIVRTRPLQAVATFIYWKPRHFLNSMADAMGLYLPERAGFQLGYLSAEQRREQDVYLNLFRLPALVALALCVWAASVTRLDVRNVGAVLAVIWLSSVIPAMASYPLPHVMGSAFATTAAGIYALAWISLVAIIRKLKVRRLSPVAHAPVATATSGRGTTKRPPFSR